jgi:DNA sulfur modification protein DndB
MPLDATPMLSFPAIRGIQAGREYFVSMWKLRNLTQLTIFDEENLPPDLRAQRVLNRSRIPEMANYILAHREDYVFSALTISIDSRVSFEPIGAQGAAADIGVLRVPMEARFIINDGQHRRAAIKEALEQRPELGNETISVVFFLDIGLARSQQMFTDLNRYAIRPSRSLSLLYDHRDQRAELARRVIQESDYFRDLVDMEHSSLALRSQKLFTLSAFYNATAELMTDVGTGNVEHDAVVARDFWETVFRCFPLWGQIQSGKTAASEARENYIHSHGIALQAIGRAGRMLINQGGRGWKTRLLRLQEIDWSRRNKNLWEGRALVGGKVSKATTNVVLTTNVVKIQLGIDLTPEEQRVESSCRKPLKR